MKKTAYLPVVLIATISFAISAKAIEADWEDVSEIGNKWKHADCNATVATWLLGYEGLARQDYRLAIENFSQLGRPQVARQLLEWAGELAKNNPKSALAMMLKGDALARVGKYEEAIKILNDSVQLDTLNPLLYDVRGLVKAVSGSQDAAASDFEKAIEIDPNFTDAVVNLGITYLANGDLMGALEYLDRAIETLPTLTLAYNARGILYSKLRAWEQAERDLKEASKLAPGLPFLGGNLRLVMWTKGETEFRASRSAAVEDSNRGTTLVALAYDRYSVPVGDDRTVDIINIKNTPQTATLAGMEAVFCHVTDELRNEGKLPADWKPNVLFAQPGLGSSAYAERGNFARMALHSGKDFVVCVDMTDKFRWPNAPKDVRMLQIDEGISRRFERAIVAANHVWEKAPDAVLESQATRMLLNGRFGSVTVADLHQRGLLSSDFKLDKVVPIGVPLRGQSINERFRTSCIGNLMTITTSSKTGFIASEPLAGAPCVQVWNRVGQPPTHGELFAERWKGSQPNPVPQLVGLYMRGNTVSTVQNYASELQNKVPMYVLSTKDPITAHLTMASMTRHGLTDPLRDGVLIACKNIQIGQMMKAQYGDGWRVQVVSETDPVRLNQMALTGKFTRINLVTDRSGATPQISGRPDGFNPQFFAGSRRLTLSEVRSVARNLDRFKDAASVLYSFSNKEMPDELKRVLNFTGPLLQDMRAVQEGQFHVLTSQTLERAGRFGMKELPTLVQHLKRAGKLPRSFTLPGPLMAGLPDIVAGAASQVGRGSFQPTWQEWNQYLSGMNKAVWYTLGTVVSKGDIKISQSFATAGGLLDDVLSEASYPAFDYVGHGFVRKDMVHSYETYLKRCSYDKLPARTFSEMYGQSFISRIGLNPSHVNQLDNKAHLLNALLPTEREQTRLSSRLLYDSRFSEIPAIITPKQDEIWKKVAPFFRPPDRHLLPIATYDDLRRYTFKPPDPPGKFGGAAVPTGSYRFPPSALPGDKRGGVIMKTDVIKGGKAEMSEIFGEDTSTTVEVSQQEGLFCPFLVFCAMPSEVETR